MSNPTIAEIKDRLNIVDVISSYIPLKKSGTNLKANCPFHTEKSASFMVSPSKQIWHCFGCGEGGDLFGFVMKYENLEFSEALKILADKAGVQLPKYTQENQEADKKKQRLISINDLSAKFYAKVLSDSSVAEVARGYLKDRGLSDKTIQEWQIGFAPDDYHVLENFLLKKGFNKQELVEAGVSAKSDKDIYDRFFNRVTFPIKNYAGDVVGFTARILEAEAKAAKYVNSPETLVYNKSRVIFGLYQSKQAIRKQDYAIVVEGNMDVIACHQAGFENTVGSSGTAFTYDQLQSLSRLTKNLKFAFDTDQAGITATKRALDLALQLGFSVYIVKMDGAKDPDEMIKKNPKLFKEAVENAPLYLDYFFEKAFINFNYNSVDQKKKVAAELIPLIRNLSDPLESAHYVNILSQRLSVPEKTIYELLAQAKPQVRAEQTEKKQAPLVKSRSFFLEQKLLGYTLFDKELREEIQEKLKQEEISDVQIKEVYSRFSGTNFGHIDGFLQTLPDELAEVAKHALFMIESEYSQFPDQAAFRREYQQILREFKTNSIKIQMNNLLSEMVNADQQKEKQKLTELNQKFLELSQALKDNQLL